MENDALRLIARLKIGASRLGMHVDVVRFVADRGYASAVLEKYLDVADEDGIIVGLQLSEKLRLAKPSEGVATITARGR